MSIYQKFVLYEKAHFRSSWSKRRPYRFRCSSMYSFCRTASDLQREQERNEVTTNLGLESGTTTSVPLPPGKTLALTMMIQDTRTTTFGRIARRCTKREEKVDGEN